MQVSPMAATAHLSGSYVAMKSVDNSKAVQQR